MKLSRRTALKGLGGLAIAGAGIGLARWGVVAPPPHERRADARTLLRAVFDELSDDARAAALHPWDHPLRLYFNRGLATGGVRVTPAALSWYGRRLLADLACESLSSEGRTRVLGQDMTRWAGVNLASLAFCGDPREGPSQAVLSTVHLNLRLGGGPVDGSALGGPQVYGDQRGNGVAGLPGNVYRYQLDAANRLRDALTLAERAAVRVAVAPAQVNVGVQGHDGTFAGLAVGDLAAPARARARTLVTAILSTYPEEAAARAARCIERNGGVDALRFADYDRDFDGEHRFGETPSQIFRLEGPAAVMHFRGHPHVHAFINIAEDGERPPGSGGLVGESARVFEGEGLQALFERTMREVAQTDAALLPRQGIVGRLHRGRIHASDVWNAESWNNELVTVEVRGRDLGPSVQSALQLRGVRVASDRLLRIAMTDHAARGDGALRGELRTLGPLREALVTGLRRTGFGS